MSDTAKKQGMETRETMLEVIRALLYETGWPPTVREIADRMGHKSTASICHHLRILKADGEIKCRPRQPGILPIDTHIVESGSEKR